MPFLMRFAAGLLTAATVVGCAGEPARKADGPVTPRPSGRWMRSIHSRHA